MPIAFFCHLFSIIYIILCPFKQLRKFLQCSVQIIFPKSETYTVSDVSSVADFIVLSIPAEVSLTRHNATAYVLFVLCPLYYYKVALLFQCRDIAKRRKNIAIAGTFECIWQEMLLRLILHVLDQLNNRFIL